MGRLLVLSSVLLCACTTPPQVSQSAPRRVVTTHNANLTSAAEVRQMAEDQCMTNGLHARLSKSKDIYRGYIPITNTVWECVE